VPLPNLLRNSWAINAPFWTTGVGGTVTNTAFTFAALALSVREQAVTPSGGTASKTFTTAALVSCPSGTVQFRLKNTHGGVVDNFSSNLTATTSPQLFTFQVTNAGLAGNGFQFLGVVNSTAGTVGTVIVHASMLIEGAWTAQQITDRGGIPATH
jgi:hypothetical protein